MTSDVGRGEGMQRILPLVLLGLSLAGCEAGGGPWSGPTAPGLAASEPSTPAAQLRVRFGGLADTIEVAAVDRLPLRAAVLAAPDGAVTAASFVNADAMPRVATGQWGVSHRWDDPAGQDNAVAALALLNPQGGRALRARQQLLAIVSNAEIPLTDPLAYRRDWHGYRIRLTFGTPPGETETIEIAAPAPPPR